VLELAWQMHAASFALSLPALGTTLTNGIAGWMTSGDRGDVGKFWVAEEAAEDVRQALQPA
jgi:hypothetical protein